MGSRVDSTKTPNMIQDGKYYLGAPPLKTQVCIVGTGQAGITLAWYLVKKGVDVTLLEGSRNYNPNISSNLIKVPIQHIFLHRTFEVLAQ